MIMNYKALKEYICEWMLRELPSDLHYHKWAHTLDVLNAAEQIAEGEKIEDPELTMLKTAVLLHDTGYIRQYFDNEPEGCKIAKETLPEFEYTRHEIPTICDMITATTVGIEPRTHLEKIICDADLDYLGRTDFLIISETLRDELKAYGKEFSDAEWLRFEIEFMENHIYYTETARSLRNTQKRKNITLLKQSLTAIKPE